MKVINLILFLLSLILAGQSLFACPTCYYFMQDKAYQSSIPEELHYDDSQVNFDHSDLNDGELEDEDYDDE